MRDYKYNQDGTVQCIVCVELTFTPDPDALEEAMEMEEGNQEAAVMSLFDFEGGAVTLVEDELVSLTNEAGEFEVGGIWLTDKYKL
ncbi:MAG: hypothetical protein ACJZ00_00010 [Cytophagales bacterium]